MTRHDDNTRERALEMLRRGYGGVSEIARMAGMSKQLLQHWAAREGIDVNKTRARFLAAAWRHVKRRGASEEPTT